MVVGDAQSLKCQPWEGPAGAHDGVKHKQPNVWRRGPSDPCNARRSRATPICGNRKPLPYFLASSQHADEAFANAHAPLLSSIELVLKGRDEARTCIAKASLRKRNARRATSFVAFPMASKFVVSARSSPAEKCPPGVIDQAGTVRGGGERGGEEGEDSRAGWRVGGWVLCCAVLCHS